MADSLTRGARARHYLEASMQAGYTGMPEGAREAARELMRHHERRYSGVRAHALVGTDKDFDRPLEAGLRAHQRALLDREGLQHADVLAMRRELRGQGDAEGSGSRSSSSGSSAAGRAARTAQRASSSALSGGGSWPMYLLGVMLLLSLAYLLLVGKGPAALAGVAGVGVSALTAFVRPVDPVKALESGLGAAPVAAGSPPSGSSSSSSAAGATPAPGSTGYAQPFARGDIAAAERVDQGQDFALKPGAAIRAIGSAKVTAILPNWYQGQPLVAYQLLGGPAKGRTVYVAEQIAPAVKVGQLLAAGQVIGHYARTGTGIETGWARPSGETLAHATSGYTEGARTTAGVSFSRFLQSLGLP